MKQKEGERTNEQEMLIGYETRNGREKKEEKRKRKQKEGKRQRGKNARKKVQDKAKRKNDKRIENNQIYKTKI